MQDGEYDKTGTKNRTRIINIKIKERRRIKRI